MGKQTQTVEYTSLYGGSSIMVPSTPEWCSPCNGTGTRSKWDIDNLDIDEMLAEDEDGEMRKSYMRGDTDIECDHCHGEKIIAVPHWESLDDKQKKFIEEDGEARAEKAREDEMRAQGIQF